MIDPKHFDSVKTVDFHAAGEPCRVLYDALYDLPGQDMQQKLALMKSDYDNVRAFLMKEPRGHKDMFGSILTKPTTPDGDLGIVYMNSDGYLNMCVHGTICTAAAIETLKLPHKDPNRILLDAPCGRIIANLNKDDAGAVKSVTVQNVPSFVVVPEVTLHPKGFDPVKASIVFAGNLFVVSEFTQRPVLSTIMHHGSTIIQLGLAIREAARKEVVIDHPLVPKGFQVDLTVLFQRKGTAPMHVKNAVIFADGQLDRSPCGSGTSALMTYFNSLGELPIQTPYRSESIIGTFFDGQLAKTIEQSGVKCVIPQVTGKPFYTGAAEFYRSQEDELKDGFLVF